MALDLGINKSCQRYAYSSSNTVSRQTYTNSSFFQSSREETDALANSALQGNIFFNVTCVEEGREDGCFCADARSLSLPEDFPCCSKRARGRRKMGMRAQGPFTQAWSCSFQNLAVTWSTGRGSIEQPAHVLLDLF